jgi:hypothetical protein
MILGTTPLFSWTHRVESLALNITRSFCICFACFGGNNIQLTITRFANDVSEVKVTCIYMFDSLSTCSFRKLIDEF